MSIIVKLFAHYRDLLGQREVTVAARPGLTVSDVFVQLVGGKAGDELRRATLFAVNEQYVPADTALKDGDRVAFIPPVSGG
ncbi:MAG TPA: MoaD/ThiS family protein [bacterium]|nr:MoaD/ThiS family protein [bacterium]